MTPDSPIVQEVRDRAAQVEARFGNDLRRYFAHLQAQEAKHADQMWHPQRPDRVGPGSDTPQDQRPAA